MPQISKRKAHLQKISHLRSEGKRQKLDKDTKTKSALLAQQIREEDFRDDEEESCLENVELGKQGEISGEIKENPQQMMSLKWTSGAGAYLRGTRGCGSASTDKRQKRHGRELEAEVSKCKSIPEIFGTAKSVTLGVTGEARSEAGMRSSKPPSEARTPVIWRRHPYSSNLP
ncbi:hypothetical protein MMC29_003501 [Sticta canariensis]|nr:hypothetical protein [Sticta canariensis]